MPWFVKQETFTAAMTTLPPEQRRRHCHDHRLWVEAQRHAGLRIASGFLVDGDHQPGGGGLLVFEASSYAAAEQFIQQDPMIARGLVAWSLHAWKPVSGDLRA
ncbi:MAG: YciI family protein [Synechococcus sp.]